ncbi:MAG: N-acetylneuraminate lyase [Anaerorhabdus sp.]
MAKFDIKDFKGVIPAMVTPFDENENIDEKGLKELVDYLIDKGVHGLYLTGSTGEGFLMDLEERKRVVEIVIEKTNGRVPIVVHVGAISTKLSIELAKHAQEKGADGISSVPPFYYRFNESQIINYYKDISESVDIPMIVYNVPLVGLMGLETIKKLSKIEQVKGVKFTALAHYEITQIKDEIGSDFLVYSGADEMAMSGLLNGADGIIGSFYNIIPEVFLDIYQSVLNNDIEKAKEVQTTAVRIIMHCLSYPSFYAVMKYILRLENVSGGYCRRPFENLSNKQEKEVINGLRALKLKYNIKGVNFLDKL